MKCLWLLRTKPGLQMHEATAETATQPALMQDLDHVSIVC